MAHSTNPGLWENTFITPYFRLIQIIHSMHSSVIMLLLLISMITEVGVEICKLWLVQDHVWYHAFHLQMNRGVAFKF